MANKKTLSTYKLLITLLLISSSLIATAPMPEIVYRAETKEEAFQLVTYLINKIPWYNQNGYKISLPQHPEFKQFYQEPISMIEEQKSHLQELFDTEIYDISQFDKNLEIIRKTENMAKKALEKLAILEKNWGFVLKNQYDIILTLYGPGGRYHWDKDTGIVVITALPQPPFRTKKQFAKTIIHEIVHIGIERNIIRKYHLKHWEKERLVDLICSLYLKDILPNYQNQGKGDKNLDEFINETTIEQNLPAAIECFITKYPRQKPTLEKISVTNAKGKSFDVIPVHSLEDLNAIPKELGLDYRVTQEDTKKTRSCLKGIEKDNEYVRSQVFAIKDGESVIGVATLIVTPYRYFSEKLCLALENNTIVFRSFKEELQLNDPDSFILEPGWLHLLPEYRDKNLDTQLLHKY